MPNPFKDIADALDPVVFATDALHFSPDPWQCELLRSARQRIILNVSRQAGKSTVTAIMALHVCLYSPGALVLLISPSQRQSLELYQKLVTFRRALEPQVELAIDNRLSCEFRNGSRVLSLPSDPDTLRGLSAPSLVIIDEAARVSDEMLTAVSPFFATGNGRLILMSTPAGSRGSFWEIWTKASDDEWEKVYISLGMLISQDRYT